MLAANNLHNATSTLLNVSVYQCCITIIKLTGKPYYYYYQIITSYILNDESERYDYKHYQKIKTRKNCQDITDSVNANEFEPLDGSFHVMCVMILAV